MKRSNSLAAHAVIAVARQRAGFDPERCRLVIEHLDTSLQLHGAIHQALAPHQLNELQFAVLVVLFSLGPDPIGSADLAVHTAVSRPAITAALDQLEAKRLITRVRNSVDRRVIHVRLTPKGCALVEPATMDFLHIAQRITRLLDATHSQHLLAGCALLQEGASTAQS